MSASLGSEDTHRSFGGLQQWSENCEADGNVLVAPCRQLANSGTVQSGPSDDAYPSAAHF